MSANKDKNELSNLRNINSILPQQLVNKLRDIVNDGQITAAEIKDYSRIGKNSGIQGAAVSHPEFTRFKLTDKIQIDIEDSEIAAFDGNDFGKDDRRDLNKALELLRDGTLSKEDLKELGAKADANDIKKGEKEFFFGEFRLKAPLSEGFQPEQANDKGLER